MKMENFKEYLEFMGLVAACATILWMMSIVY